VSARQIIGSIFYLPNLTLKRLMLKKGFGFFYEAAFVITGLPFLSLFLFKSVCYFIKLQN